VTLGNSFGPLSRELRVGRWTEFVFQSNARFCERGAAAPAALLADIDPRLVTCERTKKSWGTTECAFRAGAGGGRNTVVGCRHNAWQDVCASEDVVVPCHGVLRRLAGSVDVPIVACSITERTSPRTSESRASRNLVSYDLSGPEFDELQ
jgi:hypothetical protein